MEIFQFILTILENMDIIINEGKGPFQVILEAVLFYLIWHSIGNISSLTPLKTA